MTSEKINILMVDDQPAKLLSYEVILAELGENLIKAHSASDALNILLKTDIAVVLMDVSMPDVDGFELADVIRQHPRFQKTAIIFISGVHLADSDKIQGYRSGAVDYISVPVIPEVLRAKVAVFVELHRKTRMLEKLNSELERRVAERTEELQESESRFRTQANLLELASEAIIVRDLQGAIQFWNAGAETLYGWSREEAIGQDMHRLLKTVFPVSREDVEKTLAEKGSWLGNLIQQTRSGREIIVACRKTMNREGNAVLEVNRDITVQIKAEEALRESEKLAAMGRVAGIIAHEINNPLAAITNIFYLLRNHPSLSDEARGYADAAEQELVRVSHITRQTLSFYRESKQPTPVRVHELLDDVAELQNRAFQVNKIELRKKYSSASNVTGFPVELRQVFLNLIANAVQAMPKGGVLRLHVHEATDWMTQRRGPAISVIDTGVGIKPEDAQRLFEPFYSTKAAKGTGLGLWISKGILQKYSGRISYRSYRRNHECITCFRVFLPGNGTLNLVPDGSDGASNLEQEHTKNGEGKWRASEASHPGVISAITLR
ncbi:MAG TPA: ATP-binding protein [Terracidiphilus sp.]|jgi:PAS domain S-box-containing protein|nr:ATP-binding protein [Terracidiphilus sp.]